MSGRLKVDPTDLTRKAEMIDGLPWGRNPSEVQLAAPDTLAATETSLQNLSKNAAALGAEQQWGIQESRRLAETLRLVATAYETVDTQSRNAIDASMPGGSGAATPAPVPIGTNTAPAPQAPPPMDPFDNVQASRQMLDPIETDTLLAGGDQAVSLRAAATEWTAHAATLTEASLPFDVRIEDWEGVAAETAYTKFKTFGGWLRALAGKWTQLAAEANKLATAHDEARAANAPVRAEYESLRDQLLTGGGLASTQAAALQTRMTELYQESETIRQNYAGNGQPTVVPAPQPRPDSVAPASSVAGNGDPHARGVPARTERERDTPGDDLAGPGTPGAGGGQPGARSAGGQGAPPAPPREAAAAPPPVTDQLAQSGQQAAQQAGSAGAGQPGAGQPGGGQPGGQPGGGLPSGLPAGGPPTSATGAEPRSPRDPMLRPAATGAGAGSGSGAGAGGGSGSALPLQPAVGAETVAPGPVVPAGAVPLPGSGSGGATAGGMGGGVAPMGMGAGAGASHGSGEKKRNPQLAPDEALYVEDRPHTEQVIGVRRRRGTSDDAKKGETS